jgi:hypothetical protein
MSGWALLIKNLLFPLAEKLVKWLASRLSIFVKLARHEKKVRRAVKEGTDEQDQRVIEDIIGKGGEPSGRGVIVDSLPNVKLREQKADKSGDLAK